MPNASIPALELFPERTLKYVFDALSIVPRVILPLNFAFAAVKVAIPIDGPFIEFVKLMFVELIVPAVRIPLILTLLSKVTSCSN